MKCRINNRMAGNITAMLLFYITVGVTQGYCQDFFMGKVLSVNIQEREIQVAPQVAAKKLESDFQGENVLVQSKLALPDCVILGAKIRLWGERLPGDINTFIATEIRGCRGGGCSDPTGVRSRLSRRGKYYRNSSNDGHPTDHSTGAEGNGRGSSGGGKGNGRGGNGGGGGGVR